MFAIPLVAVAEAKVVKPSLTVTFPYGMYSPGAETCTYTWGVLVLEIGEPIGVIVVVVATGGNALDGPPKTMSTGVGKILPVLIP